MHISHPYNVITKIRLHIGGLAHFHHNFFVLPHPNIAFLYILHAYTKRNDLVVSRSSTSIIPVVTRELYVYRMNTILILKGDKNICCIYILLWCYMLSWMCMLELKWIEEIPKFRWHILNHNQWPVFIEIVSFIVMSIQPLALIHLAILEIYFRSTITT